jgi:hypothetical protein
LNDQAVELEWWNAEVDELVRYWTTRSDDSVQDARFDAVMTELAAIKRMVRTLTHG